jgi:hypothetical protein
VRELGVGGIAVSEHMLNMHKAPGSILQYPVQKKKVRELRLGQI